MFNSIAIPVKKVQILSKDINLNMVNKPIILVFVSRYGESYMLFFFSFRWIIP